MYPAAKSLWDELDKTGVISEDFKSLIRSWCYQIMKEAYERGVEDERNRKEQT